MSPAAVIMAGGKGTRISSVRSDIPKPMIDVCGKPVLERQIECLKENGITELVLVTGHLSEAIETYFGDGAFWGVHIRYIQEKVPLGTAGALYYLRDLTDDFFLLNGDIIFDVDLERMMAFHRASGAEITLFAHPNSHPYDSALLVRDQTGRVTQWLRERSDTTRNCVNAGIHILSPRALQGIGRPEPKNLDRDLIAGAIEKGLVYAYTSPEYVHDMGTPERYLDVCRDVEEGIPARKNLKRPQRAVFLDRDGTINTYRGFITDPDQIELEPGAAETIRRINRSGYLAIVVTNQPVLARGECTAEGLERIHGRLEHLLGKEGAYLDGIFYCPHHPDKGFPGEVAALKRDCACRKPKPGLLLQAAEQFSIDLSASWMVGDSMRDVEAGRAAGCTPVLIGEEPNGEDVLTAQNLAAAVEQILNVQEGQQIWQQER